jgi:GT2 family glycosyltransferase
MDLSAQQEVTAVIVNYGNCNDTAELISTIKDQINSIIVIDNSNDIDPASAEFENTTVITPSENIGFGAAVNLATEQTQTRWLLILNPDVRLQDNCLQLLLNASCQLNAPLCGPRFFWDDGCTLQLPPALGHPLWLLSDRHIPNKNPTDSPDLGTLAIARHVRFWKETAPFSEPVLSGACLLVDNQWFRQHKMPVFDEDFFLYYEDTDLCGRLMRKGVMPVCVAEAKAVHYWNQSAEPPESKASLMSASEKIFLKKYFPNGPPPLPRSTQQAEFTDLGKMSSAPELLISDDATHLDIGVQDDFIVFARAELKPPAFTFTQPMWQRLRDGGYYLRTVDQSGQSLNFWQFEKQTPEGALT